MTSAKTLKLEPAILTIFGITGDLAHRKLLPALYHLAENDLLPAEFKIIGTTRQHIQKNDVLDKMKQNIENAGEKVTEKTLRVIENCLEVITLDIGQPEAYGPLKQKLDSVEDDMGVCLHRLFYLAVPADVFNTVIVRLGKSDLNSGCRHGSTESRLLIEKPFGHDLKSAEELVTSLSASFEEKDIYRIDHYLAKETVQNIMTLRFANPLFKSVWNRDHVSYITITAAESLGIESRVNFYEQTGAMRDIIQSHLLQILALVTMAQPKTNSATAIHAARQEILDAICSPQPTDMISQTARAQYAGYKKEVENDESQTETYAAARFTIDSQTWRNVPILIRTGKNLKEKTTNVIVAFRDKTDRTLINHLTIRIQPNEGIILDLRIKKPGYQDEVEQVKMDFNYSPQIDASHPDAYERVLVDTLRGDKTLFATSDAVIASWKAVQPILDAWEQGSVPLETYEVGSWGPSGATELAKIDDIVW